MSRAMCERCWYLSLGSYERYMTLVQKENCTPEQQAGENAEVCPECGRRALHQHARCCMACDYDPKDREAKP